jgi:hypothetical protein
MSFPIIRKMDLTLRLKKALILLKIIHGLPSGQSGNHTVGRKVGTS